MLLRDATHATVQLPTFAGLHGCTHRAARGRPLLPQSAVLVSRQGEGGIRQGRNVFNRATAHVDVRALYHTAPAGRSDLRG